MLIVLAVAGFVGVAPASAQVRGFDGETVKVAGLGIKQQLPKAEEGAQARIKRFNDTNEIKGIQIEYSELADDKQDPATALSEARRLVTQEQVFAIVGDVSANNPGEFFTQQKVPYFGGGFDNTYCSNKPSTSLWGFSSGGCVVPEDPSFVSDNFHNYYKLASEKSGKKHPTLVLFGNDNTAAKNGNRVFAIASQGAGFKVTDVQNDMPLPGGVTDYTPYAQKVLEGNSGKQPDAVFCTDGVQCLNMFAQLKASGFTGLYASGLYSDALVTALDGSYINITTNNYSDPSKGMKQLKADLDAYAPGSSAKMDSGDVYGYTSTDMFIQALKIVAKKGKSNITPENIQKAASTLTWKIDGVMGPTQYPKATVMGFPACSSNSFSDGTTWQLVEKFSCSTKTYSPNTKIK
jgi:ABC-type branched-subunit amino acid transport system substrate-binding protein